MVLQKKKFYKITKFVFEKETGQTGSFSDEYGRCYGHTAQSAAYKCLIKAIKKFPMIKIEPNEKWFIVLHDITKKTDMTFKIDSKLSISGRKNGTGLQFVYRFVYTIKKSPDSIDTSNIPSVDIKANDSNQIPTEQFSVMDLA
jgi:hypothetical protein